MSEKFVVKESKLTASEVAAKFKSLLENKDIKIFAHIDHRAAAEDCGLTLSDEQVIVFGDPRVGTNLMQEKPQIGIELPLKILISTEDGVTKVSYREPLSYLEEFGIVRNREVVEKMSGLMANLVGAVIE